MFGRGCMLFFLTVLWGGILSGRSIGEEVLRVACYNVEFSRSATPQQIGEMFRPYPLDVIGFNEVPGGDWTKQVGEVLGMPYCWVGKISSAHHKDKYKSILSRYPLEDCTEVELVVRRGWNPASAVHANIHFQGRIVSFYSIHLCNNRLPGEDHATMLVEKTLAHDSASVIVVAGDFNCLRDAPGMQCFREAGFQNAWEALSIETEKNFTWNAQNLQQNEGVIDHILLRGKAEFADGEILEMDKPLSDHKPIHATLRLR
ncbi:MAG: endonuclease/exonuclease/phosphatase family protein [Planctomycetia bacterium]|nr:endonuclease/exonuclease/phosphatase family protein [Planctomycetia bacterium]